MDNQKEEAESPRCLRVPMKKHPIKQLVQRLISDHDVDPSSSLWSRIRILGAISRS
uniref:Uncharacterized protein n=1 Tax=Hyaloperonospora arabidopsidis (strain Emoy2) TaxID=559515 RepID=M4C1V5_HYAAE